MVGQEGSKEKRIGIANWHTSTCCKGIVRPGRHFVRRLMSSVKPAQRSLCKTRCRCAVGLVVVATVLGKLEWRGDTAQHRNGAK